jgi:ABC-type transport system substrate-binding protein
MWNRFNQSLIAIVLVLSATPGSVHAAAATGSADPSKVIRLAWEAADDGFDLMRTSSHYSNWVGEAIFERLLTYDYLARPAKLVPQTAEAMPQVSADGKVYTFQIKKGIYFTPDPVFKGARRELTAQDYVYTLKRTLDPQNRSQIASFLEGKLVGLDEQVAKAKVSGHFDYDAPVAGLRAIDRYTLRIELKQVDYNFLYLMAYTGFGAVAREVTEAYGLQSGAHPVGTGPYILQQYVPRSKIVLTANPDYRGFIWDFKSSGDAGDAKLIAEMQGKKMPQIGRVEISIIDEDQPRWLGFQDKQHDLVMLPQSVAPNVIDVDKLKPEFTQQNIGLSRFVEPEITYTLFNFNDPLTGGFSNEKIALRRAIAMAYSVPEEISKLRLGQAVKAEMVIPPGIVGHDPSYRSSITYDIVLANKLLDHFGYKRGADGFRNLPDGKPLVLKITTEATSSSKIVSEVWKRGLDQIGIHAEHLVSNFADNLKAAQECKLMMWGGAWLPDYPDGENFLQLLYGPNAHQGNHGCYNSPAFNVLYVKAKTLPPGPERNALYLQMNRQMEADTAWSVHISRIRNWLTRPWVKGFKKHPVMHVDFEYLDIDKNLLK